MRQTEENISPRCSHLLVKHWELHLLQGQPKTLQQCLAGSNHSIRPGAQQQAALSGAGRQSIGTRNQKLTCAAHPFKQDHCKETAIAAELSRDERHIYMAGYLNFVNYILFNHVTLLLLAGLSHVILCYGGNNT